MIAAKMVSVRFWEGENTTFGAAAPPDSRGGYVPIG